MSGGRQVLVGLLLALLTSGLALGSISLSLLESGYVLVGGPGAPGLQITFSGEPVLMLAKDATATAAALAELAGIVPPAGTATNAGAPVCAYPAGWKPWAVQPDQTLRGLARLYGVSVDTLKTANCLVASSLAPGSLLYLPPQAARPSGPTTTTCRPPYAWVAYSVRPGDTLARVAASVGQSAWSLQSANCLSSAYLYVGQMLYVPYYPAFNSYPTATRWSWPTATSGTPMWPNGTPTSPFLPTNTPTGWYPTATFTTQPSATQPGPETPTATVPGGPTDTPPGPPTETQPPPPTSTSEPPTVPPPPTNTPEPPPPPPTNTPEPPPTPVPPPTSPPFPTNTPGSYPYP